MPRRQVALVAGASGIVGYRVAQSLAATGNWEVIGISRTPPARRAGFDFLPVDLINADDCRSKISSLTRVTHLFYAAKYSFSRERAKSDRELIDLSLVMLANLLEPLDRNTGALRHVHLVHGTGHYGSSLKYRKTPFKEDDPRHPGNTFYYAQQDFIVDRQKGRRWAWSISRPQVICDHAGHVARSVPLGIAVYGSICKAMRAPFSFPGCRGNYHAIQQCTDASHLANAMMWMATNDQCANQAFNVTNGDCFRWKNLWPKLADSLGVIADGVRSKSLARAMADKGKIWDSLSRQRKIRRASYDKLVLWPYVDRVFSAEDDQLSDVTKLHKFGFHDIVDTEEMFSRFFETYRRAGMIPR